MLLLFNVIITVGVCAADVMVWRPSNNILNPTNWLKSPSDCPGIVFSAESYSFTVLDSRYRVEALVLPRNGDIFLASGAVIEFGQKDACIALKPLPRHEWADPKNWHILLGGDNPAIPDVELMPCPDTNVMTKVDLNTAMILPPFMEVSINSMEFGYGASFVEPEEQSVLDGFLQTDFGRAVFYRTTTAVSPIRIVGDRCKNALDCVCENYDVRMCYTDEESGHKCLNPVRPAGFCRHICGAYILLKPPESKERVQQLRDLFEGNGNAWAIKGQWISRVRNGDEEVFQIVFTEREFTGSSLTKARTFLDTLHREMGIVGEFYASGEYYEPGEETRKFLSMSLGTLFAVLLVFIVIYVLFETSLLDRYLDTRMSYVWARYDKRSEPKLIFGEGGSMAGSVLSLENPMYGQPASSATFDRVESVDDPRVNPLFEMGDINGEEERAKDAGM